MIAAKNGKSLKQIFQDTNYAWDLLEAEVKLETSQSQVISGQDISNLLQLYMRGVEKMNTLVDIRQSFFKNRVTNLMSRPTVIRILNKPMTKKSQPAVVSCLSPESSKNPKQKQQILSSQSPKRLDAHKQMQLKQKKQSLQMRLAYSAQQNNPDALKKMLAEHSQKETIISSKIQKIVDSHEEKLRKRINERKMKTLTARTKSQVVMENYLGQNINDTFNQFQSRVVNMEENKMAIFVQKKQENIMSDKIQMNQRQANGESRQGLKQINIDKNHRKKHRSIEQKVLRSFDQEQDKQNRKRKLNRRLSLGINGEQAFKLSQSLVSRQIKEKKIGDK